MAMPKAPSPSLWIGWNWKRQAKKASTSAWVSYMDLPSRRRLSGQGLGLVQGRPGLRRRNQLVRLGEYGGRLGIAAELAQHPAVGAQVGCLLGSKHDGAEEQFG